ncbi:MAG: DUF4982 domain-containing protein [Clostridia bacterium]|nr:DUF4982 domain-containing protein [Clostridia bacterium]
MRKLWNDNWMFTKLPLGSAYADMKAAALCPITLPHDWLIENTEDLYESGDGWYVKTLKNEGLDACVLLDFDGVYMDADVLLNGEILCTHRYGYTPFFVDLSGKLKTGDNEIAVHIRHQSPNSRWYSGAGIYRSVRLLSLPKRHMIPDGFQVNTARNGEKWVLTVEAEIAGEGEELPEAILRTVSGKILAAGRMEKSSSGAALSLHVAGVQPWSIQDPVLYSLELTLGTQKETMNIGFRETEFTPDRGFFLNGEHVKLHGVCLHHDLGALGAAFNADAALRQLQVMMDMGVNAIRTSHNPPARELLELCDFLGLLVMDELYDMWELPKTDYDNARFFPETYPQDVAAWVRRDRWHPSVILWSIGNEIYDMQASDRGQLWTRLLMEEVRKHDDRHAAVTFASNYMPWEGAQKCADIVKLPGYNYAEKYYDAHHGQHPDWVIYGSETGSLLASRGVYHFPMQEDILSDEDLQCSALLNSNTSWGAKDIRKLLTDDLNTEYSLGQFIWAGIDYIGEPTPYHTRSCYFGQTDTACFPKDAYYFYQAMWTDKPMIHIGVYWDWNEGQLIDVPVMTNGACAELFLNGRSLGKKRVNRRDPEACLPVWQVPYEKGQLKAVAYDEAGAVLCQTVRASFGEAETLKIEKNAMFSQGDVAFLTVSALDAAGNPVENAVNRVYVSIDGPGVLLGVDNGDSTDRDGYKTFSRRLFSGKLLIMIGTRVEGEIKVTVTSPGLKPAETTLRARKVWDDDPMFNDLCRKEKTDDGLFIRKIGLKSLSSTVLTPEHPAVEIETAVLPENAFSQPLSFRVVNAQGVEMPFAKVERAGSRVIVTALGDGSAYLRATANNGYPHARVISSLEISAEGFGPMGLNPYKFVSASLCDVRVGDIGAGNEQGVAFARDGESAVGFTNVDFGPEGSDEITLPIFALNGDMYRLMLWDGAPGEGGKLICELPYQKKSIWNTYQAETWRLPEALRGVHDLFFSLDSKIHLKGFSFTRQSRALRYNSAGEADQLYGDSFIKEGNAVKRIGNNVTLAFQAMDFGGGGKYQLILDGATPLPVNTVSLRVVSEQGETAVTTCAFQKSERGEQAFEIDAPKGLCEVSFVFLPGSSFDFYGFRFNPRSPFCT